MENKLMELFKGMDDSEIIDVWREYCSNTNNYDDEIFTMDYFNELYANDDPEEIARRCFYGHDIYGDESSFNPNREYFYLNGYGNPVSLDYIGYNEYADRFMCDRLDIDSMIDYIIENDNDLYNDDIREILDEEDE